MINQSNQHDRRAQGDADMPKWSASAANLPGSYSRGGKNIVFIIIHPFHWYVSKCSLTLESLFPRDDVTQSWCEMKHHFAANINKHGLSLTV